MSKELKQLLVALGVAVPLVVLATTWGPLLVFMHGGQNAANTAAQDEEVEWAGAQATAKSQLAVPFAGARVKIGDKILFKYGDGTTVQLTYRGGYPGNLSLQDPQYTTQVEDQSNGPIVAGCGGSPGGALGFTTVDIGYWTVTYRHDGSTTTVEATYVPVYFRMPEYNQTYGDPLC